MSCRAPDLCLPLPGAGIIPLEPETPPPPTPCSAFSGSCSSPQKCRFRGMSKRCTWHLAERSCYWGSVQPRWVFDSRADLVINRKVGLSTWKCYLKNTVSSFMHTLTSVTSVTKTSDLTTGWVETQTLEKEQLIYSMYNFVTRKKKDIHTGNT